MLWLADRFGWDTAHNGPVGEMRRMLAAENVYKAYKSRENYRNKDNQPDWVEWAEANPTANRILAAGMIAAGEVTDNGSNG